jgi:hypothetical protein
MFILLRFGIPSRQGTEYFIPSRFMYFWLLVFPIKNLVAFSHAKNIHLFVILS